MNSLYYAAPSTHTYEKALLSLVHPTAKAIRSSFIGGLLPDLSQFVPSLAQTRAGGRSIYFKMISRKSIPHVQSAETVQGQGQGQEHYASSRLDPIPIATAAARALSPRQNPNSSINKSHKDSCSTLPPLTIPLSPSHCHHSDGMHISRDHSHASPLTFNSWSSFSPATPSSPSPFPCSLSHPTHASPPSSPQHSLLLPPTRSASPHLVALTPPRLVSSC